MGNSNNPGQNANQQQQMRQYQQQQQQQQYQHLYQQNNQSVQFQNRDQRAPQQPQQQQQQQRPPPQQQQQAMSPEQQRQIMNGLYTNQALHTVDPMQSYMIFFGNVAGQGQQVHRAADIEQKQAVAVKNDIMIDPKSFQLVPNEHDPSLLHLTFKMNFEVEAAVGIFYSASEVKDQRNLTLDVVPDNPSYQPNHYYKFQPCKNFDYPKELYPLSIQAFNRNQIFKYTSNKFPIIVKIEKIDKSKELKYMYHYLTVKLNSGHYQVVQIGQKLELNAVAYMLQEVYGIGDSKLNENGVESEQKDCLICMCDKPDTIINPCRHMCLCYDCCLDLRLKANKCPMCRTEITSYVRITSFTQKGQGGSQGQNQQDQQQFQPPLN